MKKALMLLPALGGVTALADLGAQAGATPATATKVDAPARAAAATTLISKNLDCDNGSHVRIIIRVLAGARAYVEPASGAITTRVFLDDDGATEYDTFTWEPNISGKLHVGAWTEQIAGDQWSATAACVK